MPMRELSWLISFRLTQSLLNWITSKIEYRRIVLIPTLLESYVLPIAESLLPLPELFSLSRTIERGAEPLVRPRMSSPQYVASLSPFNMVRPHSTSDRRIASTTLCCTKSFKKDVYRLWTPIFELANLRLRQDSVYRFLMDMLYIYM